MPIEIQEGHLVGTTSTLDWMRAMRELLTAPNYQELQNQAKARYANYRTELEADMKTFTLWCEDILRSNQPD